MNGELARGTLPGLSRNAVVAASAGTGKTHLITSIFLAHVLGLGPDGKAISPERIVATTFSRAAAREIRERLELRLGLIAGETKASEGIGLDSVLAELAQARGLDDKTLRARATHALELLPRTLIDTLHGLATRVLRAHALDLGLTPGFVILEEQEALDDTSAVIEEVLSRALGRGGDEEAPVRAMIDAGHGLEATVTSVSSLLSLLDEEGLDADALQMSECEQEASALTAAIGEAARAVLGSAAIEPPLRGAAQNTLQALSGLPETASALNEALKALFHDNKTKLSRLECGTVLLELLDRLPASGSKAERIQRTVSFLVSAPGLDTESRAIAALLGEMQREQRSRRRRRGALGFGDLLRLSRDALRDQPAIAARAGAAWDLMLVDEFQDTSRVQRDLVFLLRERPECCKHRSPGSLPRAQQLKPHGLVVVGDRKQSIYAFRGADVAVYAELTAELGGAPAVEALDLRGVRASETPVADIVTLRDNYRSGAAILSFVNRVAEADFSGAPSRPFEIRYMPSEALRPPPRPAVSPGRVTLLVDDGASPGAIEPLLENARGPLRTALVVAGFCATLHQEGASYREVALLARRRSSLPLLELGLDRLAIPFVVAGRALYATTEVRDLAALLRLTLDPYDRHALSVVARSPLGGLSDRALAELSQPGRGLQPAASWPVEELSDGSDRALARELVDRLTELSQVGPRLSPRDVLAFAVDRFELETVLAALPRGVVRFGNVGRLLELAARRGGSLAHFARWLDRQIALDVDESEAATFSEEDDAVRLLTIHASKGLSFPTTVVVDLGTAEGGRYPPFALLRSDDGSTSLVVRHRGPEGAIVTPLIARFNDDAKARALAERQRLSYVALTRAEKELVLALPPPDSTRPGSVAESLERVFREPWATGGESELRRLDAKQMLLQTPQRAPVLSRPEPVPRRPERAPFDTAAIGVTALADFALCPRRFELLHLIGLSELGAAHAAAAVHSDEARAIGSAAHRVLERFPLEAWGTPVSLPAVELLLEKEGLERGATDTRATAAGIAAFLSGDYAREVRSSAVRIHRELELSALIRQPRAVEPAQLPLFTASTPERIGVLRATLDLVVERADGGLDVVDYKRSAGGDSERYALQLFAYQAAVQQRFGDRPVRTGLLHLLGSAQEPEWVLPTPVNLSRLFDELAERRYQANFPPVPKPRCQVARCGFLRACYPRDNRKS